MLSSAQGFVRMLELDDGEGEFVVPSVDDNKMSSVGGSDTDLVRMERSDGGDLDSTLVSSGGGGGGEITSDISDVEPTAVRHSVLTAACGPQLAYMEFVEWLKRSLDEYGLEPILYARCALSILRQPPEPASDVVYQSEAAATKYLSIVRGNQNSRNNNSAPSSRKNSFGSLALALADDPISSAVPNHDSRKQALLDCLKTINCDKVEVKRFVEEIVHRYTSACKQGVFGEKQNDSVDSGVCPSPEESFQNYDEAFPPLAGDCSLNGITFDERFTEIALPRPERLCASSLNGKRPADANDKSTCDDLPDIVGGTEDQLEDGDYFMSSAYAGGDSSPVKRLKLNADLGSNERGGRSLKSCPDFVLSSSGTGISGGNVEKRATFCCPVVKKQQPPHNWPIVAGGNHQPQFVIPKCWTVGSWPSRYDRSSKPAGDVPFWSCSEWFCTVHKRLEFGMLNAKINGDTNSLAAPPPPPTAIFSKNIDSTAAICEFEALDNNVDMDIFEIESATGPPNSQQQQEQTEQQQNWMFGQSARQSTNNASEHQPPPPYIFPDMFDAPKFIMRIINEDDAALKEPSPLRKCNNGTGGGVDDEKSENDPPASSHWTPLDTFPGADSMIASLHAGSSNVHQQYVYDDGLQWPPQPASTTSTTLTAAACSKFSFCSMVDSQGGEATAGFETLLPVVDVSGVTNSDYGFCLPKCDRFPSVGRQQRQQQLLAPAATLGAVGDDAPPSKQQQQAQQGADAKDTNPKKLPQSMAVPIKESTHFIPIRSESMEDAYYLKPGFDEFGSAINDMEGYYIFHHNESISIGTATAGRMENGGASCGKQRRTLVVKFRATNPDKMCQTDEQPATTNCGGTKEEGGVDEEFQIWSYQLDQPGSVAAVTSPRWTDDENLCGKMPDTTTYNDFSSCIDNGWFNDLLGDPAMKVEQQVTTSDDGGDGDQYATKGWGDRVDASDAIQAPPLATTADGQQQLEKWQKEDERYEDSLLRYVSSISLISPLDVQSTTTTTV